MPDIIDKNGYSTLSERLRVFGLTDGEARIYTYLFHKPPQSILAISRELSLPRTSVYDYAEKLIARGLVAKVVTFKSQLLRAMPLDMLQAVVDDKKATVEELEKNLNYLKKTMQHSIHPQFHTETKYYHGEHGFKQMMWNTLQATGGILRYPEYGRIEIVGKKFYHSWVEEILDRGITERALINPRQETLNHFLKTDQYVSRSRYQTTRMLEENTLYVSGDTTIYNNTFAVCFWKQGEIVGVEIENAELVKTQKSIFETLWKISKPIPDTIFHAFE